jgi:hypothetical protein
LSRGDRNRNARLARFRLLVPLSNAIVGIDLADERQAAVVTDHDSRVLARRQVRARAWELGELLDWAVARAREADFASMPRRHSSGSSSVWQAARYEEREPLSREARRIADAGGVCA